MAAFAPTTVNRTAVRDLVTPITSVTSFNNIIDDNSFECIGYTTRAGETIAAVVRNREHYTLMSELHRR